LRQVSPVVQKSPSSQGVPLGAGTMTQTFLGPATWPVLHSATVHGSVFSAAQSSAHGLEDEPPAPLELLLELEPLEVELASCVDEDPPHPTSQTTGRNRRTWFMEAEANPIEATSPSRSRRTRKLA
jgi:hypothetical protein